jgi:ATP-dependent helicase/DNAse subunit B
MADVLGGLSDLSTRATTAEYLARLLTAFEATTRMTVERSAVVSEARKLLGVSDVAGPITFSYFRELLRSQLDAGAPRRETFGRGGPTVLNVMSARGLRFPITIVPGLVEREFPLRRRQDPVLLDGERKRLNDVHGDDPMRALPLRSAGIDEERLLFRLALGAAADKVVVSFPRLDPATARPRVASAFLLRLLEELTGERHDYEKLERSRLVTRVPLSRRFPAARRDALTREEFDGASTIRAVRSGAPEEIAYLVQEAGPLSDRLDMEEERWGKPYFTRFDGILRDDALAAASTLSGYTREGRPGKAVSATSLEEYATCPFRFFMHHVLGLEPVEEPEEVLELSPLDRGQLYHAVLEDFLTEQKAEGSALSLQSRDALFRTSERLVESGPWSLLAYGGARLLVLRELETDLALWLADELHDDSGLVPSHFEVRFGGEIRNRDDADLSTEDGVPFDALGGVHVEFGGRIDRIDVSRDGRRARVIDYKSGKHPGRKKRVIYRGKRLQLPIYLMAARMMLGARHEAIDIESAEYRYVTVHGGDNSLALGSALLDERADDLRKAVGIIIGEGIASGMFFPYPESSACGNCDYAEACTSAAVSLAAMKNGDRRVGFFTNALAEID